MGNREELESAITDALATHDQENGYVTTSWVLARAGWHPELTVDGEQFYTYELAPGQPIHVTRGLIEMASTHFDEGCRKP